MVILGVKSSDILKLIESGTWTWWQYHFVWQYSKSEYD